MYFIPYRHKPIAVCTAFQGGDAYAACAFALQADGAWQQLFPAGQFRARDGRPANVPARHWQMDGKIAAALIQQFALRKTDTVIDYEHQTLHSENNGKDAPASGWMKELQWREGQGLFVRVDWTAKARQMIKDSEYRYLSPVFKYDPKTGAVLSIEMAAITNNPGLDGMQALAAMRNNTNPEEKPVEFLKTLIAILGLKADADEAGVTAALTSLVAANKAAADVVAALRKELGVDDKADQAAMVAACTQLKSTDAPDPTKYVPVAAVNALQGKVEALTKLVEGREQENLHVLVNTAVEDGRLIGELKDWALDLGKKDLAALKSFLGAAQPIAALTGTQTSGKAPVNKDTGLTESEEAVCTNMGISPEDYKKAKADLAIA